jgi:hypothetical protein
MILEAHEQSSCLGALLPLIKACKCWNQPLWMGAGQCPALRLSGNELALDGEMKSG